MRRRFGTMLSGAAIAGLATATLAAGGIPAAAMDAGGAASGRAAASVAAAPPAGCRAIPVEADGPHRSAEAREAFGVDGTGVTIGIISDSFGAATDRVTTPEQDVALGVLPGPGNPCGYETPVEVIADAPAGGGSDEGRAMAQLVHGIAPGARLLFASQQTTDLPVEPRLVLNAVLLLADAGADIIVDDIGEHAVDLYFQKGPTSAQMDQLSARHPDLVFVSSIGNDNTVGPAGTPAAGRPIASWQTPAYRATACPDWMTDGTPEDVDCLDFSPDSAGDPTYGVELLAAATPEWSKVQWGNSATLGELPDVLEMRIYDETHTRVATSTHGVPFAPVSYVPGDPPLADLPPGHYDIVITRTRSGGGDPAVWMVPFAGQEAQMLPEYFMSTGDDVVGPASYGHPVHGSAIGVGAANWTTPESPTTYSSLGPGIELFGPFSDGEAPPLAEPIITTAPQIMGVDGTQTSFFGAQDPLGAFRFEGTSAAAPHVAAVLALARSYAPDTPRAELERLLFETALPMTNPYAEFGYDDANVIGSGLANAYGLLEALTPPPTPTPAPVPPSPSPTAAPAALPATGATDAALPFALLLASIGLGLFMLRHRSRRREVSAARSDALPRARR